MAGGTRPRGPSAPRALRSAKLRGARCLGQGHRSPSPARGSEHRVASWRGMDGLEGRPPCRNPMWPSRRATGRASITSVANEHRTRDAAIWGGALGAGAGVVLAGRPGAIAGLVGVALATALAKPGALWGRILHSALLMALVGALLGLVLGPLPTAIVCGGLVGLLGARPAKLALGIATGVVVGLVIDDAALAGALTALAYRL